MFTKIDGLPEDVLALEAHGMLTHTDYVEHVIPLADALLEKHQPFKLIYVAGEDFTGIEPAAFWDDLSYALKHRYDVSHVAMVTDHAWLRALAGMFILFFPAQVRVFGMAELDEAKRWIADPNGESIAA